MGRNVLVIVNRRKPDAQQALERVSALIERHGSLVGVVDSQSDDEVPDTPIDLVAVLGGDGSLLAATRRLHGIDAPILGVNIGRVGFMSAFELEGIDEHASGVFGAGELSIRTTSTIDCSLQRGSADVPWTEVGGGVRRAINEFVVTAGPPYRMITLGVKLDGKPGPRISGDGMIVATPMGSTAYNVSAGGPIVAPEVDAMVLTPIAAHSLSFRPLVVPASSEIELTVSDVNAFEGAGTTLVTDGQVHERLEEGDRLVFKRSDAPVRFVVDPGSSYWATLQSKMRWAVGPNGRTPRA